MVCLYTCKLACGLLTNWHRYNAMCSNCQPLLLHMPKQHNWSWMKLNKLPRLPRKLLPNKLLLALLPGCYSAHMWCWQPRLTCIKCSWYVRKMKPQLLEEDLWVAVVWKGFCWFLCKRIARLKVTQGLTQAGLIVMRLVCIRWEITCRVKQGFCPLEVALP